MFFLFCLDLNLHAGVGNFFGILNLATKQGVVLINESQPAATDLTLTFSIREEKIATQ